MFERIHGKKSIATAVLAIIAFLMTFIACTGCVAERFIVARYNHLEPGQLWEDTVTASNRAERAERCSDLSEIVISR